MAVLVLLGTKLRRGADGALFKRDSSAQWLLVGGTALDLTLAKK